MTSPASAARARAAARARRPPLRRHRTDRTVRVGFTARCVATQLKAWRLDHPPWRANPWPSSPRSDLIQHAHARASMHAFRARPSRLPAQTGPSVVKPVYASVLHVYVMDGLDEPATVRHGAPARLLSRVLQVWCGNTSCGLSHTLYTFWRMSTVCALAVLQTRLTSDSTPHSGAHFVCV